MRRDEVPTQLLDLKSSDFGARRVERPGGRIHSLGLPPPTEMIRADLLLREDVEVIQHVRREQRSFTHRALKLMSTWVANGRLILGAIGARLRPGPWVRIVGETTILRVKASPDAKIAARAEVGDRLFLHPELACRPGWVLARTMEGEVGFVQASHLA